MPVLPPPPPLLKGPSKVQACLRGTELPLLGRGENGPLQRRAARPEVAGLGFCLSEPLARPPREAPLPSVARRALEARRAPACGKSQGM